MPSKDKPYRVYRGGRAKEPLKPAGAPALRPERVIEDRPQEVRPQELRRPDVGVEPARYPGPGPRRRGVRRAVRSVLLLLLLVVLVAVGWGLAGYFAFRGGVAKADARLDRDTRLALAPQDGAVLSAPSNVLLLGTDRGSGRQGGRADAIVLVRTDPDEHRIALLSIPRDLRVEIPGRGFDKVNSAFSLGGPALAIRTIERLTGLQINHIALVDFAAFAEVVDALGGITIDVPARIRSNRFACPFESRAECERWPGWRFQAGPQRMDGRRALVYSRVRENLLAPAETDLTRGGRQQQVIQAMVDKLVSFGTYLRAPWFGGDVLEPLTTDLSAWQLLQLAWVKFRTPASGFIRCRLGGSPTEIGDVSFLIGTEENVSVVHMVTGETAPQPPPPDSGPFGPGCLVGE